MAVTIGFYRGRHVGKFWPWLLAWWMRSEYNHCAIVWEVHEGTAVVSEARFWTGVRTGPREWRQGDWDCWVIDVDADRVRAWWDQHAGQKYDLAGIFGFIFRRIKGGLRAWWCSEAVMASIGMPDPWRWDVGLVHAYVRAHGRQL